MLYLKGAHSLHVHLNHVELQQNEIEIPEEVLIPERP
tara:strand:- start:663 stop:773 length:111 start_codon:yes stop_codon:yes gene_type:complete